MLEKAVAEQGSTCTWLPGGTLRVSTVCAAVTTHAATGEEVWFNQAEQWHPSALKPAFRALFERVLGKGRFPHDCEYGNGELIDERTLLQIRSALSQCKRQFDWQRDDVLVLDNVLTLHGRESFKGKRETLAYLSAT